jgi:predicted CXXCH cytochrome family protein
MPPPAAGKPQPARIPLNYFRQGDRMRRWKLNLTIAASAAAAVWWLSGYLQSDSGRQRYSRGPVATAHAVWDDKCETCHTSFQPIRSDSWAAGLLSSAHVNDPKCMSCHSGPVHHANQTSTPPCAACHREHRGREASLVHMPDQLCVDCHKDLKSHIIWDYSRTGFENVTRFDGGHPQFHFSDGDGGRVSVRSDPPAKDPGQLKFNHHLHMSRGLDASGKLFLYRNIADDAQRDWYWRLRHPTEDLPVDSPQKLDAPVELTCAACHRLEAKDFPILEDQLAGLPREAVLPPRAAGAAMLPITYENQCKACHPLTFDGKEAVPHRLQPEQVSKYLESYFTQRWLQEKPTLFEKKQPMRLIPGKKPDDEMIAVRKRIETEVRQAESVLYEGKTTCKECHEYERQEGKGVPERIVPPNIPTIWLPHAKFNHTIHRVIDCESCHDGARDSKTSADVLLPGIETCQQCHAPPSRTRGGARYDCTECHRYHHGDAPLRGFGTEKRDPDRRRTIGEVLGK